MKRETQKKEGKDSGRNGYNKDVNFHPTPEKVMGNEYKKFQS